MHRYQYCGTFHSQIVEQRAFLTSQRIEHEKYLEESSSEDESEEEEESISDNESQGAASVVVSYNSESNSPRYFRI